MLDLLTPQQLDRYAQFNAFVSEKVEGHADAWDQEQRLPEAILCDLAAAGYLGSNLPTEYGGLGWDTVTFGLLSEALGRGSSSLAVTVTVQEMVAMALLKWGTSEQKSKWLPLLTKGEILGAFALTEPGAGSALESLVTEFVQRPGDECLTLRGEKKWISCAQRAGVFLVFGKLGQQPLACIVPRETPGLKIKPIRDMMGFRAAGMGQLYFDDVKIPPENVIAKPGFGLSHVATFGLQYGRISTSCSALGVVRACFEDSITYAAARKIGNQTVGELGMPRSLIARMGTDLNAGKLLCYEACRAADERHPDVFEKTLMAKYFTSKAAVSAASDAVQIRGASGCHSSSPVSRYYRDSKIMEIIEGTTQIHEQLLGKIFVNQANRLTNKAD